MTEKEKKKNVKEVVRNYKNLNVYKQSYKLAMDVFKLSKDFPREELYSLTDQLRRASRSVPANIAEGWTKRKYVNVFIKHLVDANGSCEEVKVFSSFARDCGYIEPGTYKRLLTECSEIGAMLSALIKKWKTF